jgi:hypothetical protein
VTDLLLGFGWMLLAFAALLAGGVLELAAVLTGAGLLVFEIARIARG